MGQRDKATDETEESLSEHFVIDSTIQESYLFQFYLHTLYDRDYDKLEYFFNNGIDAHVVVLGSIIDFENVSNRDKSLIELIEDVIELREKHPIEYDSPIAEKNVKEVFGKVKAFRAKEKT